MSRPTYRDPWQHGSEIVSRRRRRQTLGEVRACAECGTRISSRYDRCARCYQAEIRRIEREGWSVCNVCGKLRGGHFPECAARARADR